ncbi:beta-scruin-like isoform X2 [Tachypleus tridentatus]|uniref:beta-scruin-like isoform X2 n=1 Tax=Tachypleus tridentatus TaxID=6853 RepID=UPI003FD2721E
MNETKKMRSVEESEQKTWIATSTRTEMSSETTEYTSAYESTSEMEETFVAFSRIDPSLGVIKDMPNIDTKHIKELTQKWKNLTKFSQDMPLETYTQKDSGPCVLVAGGINPSYPTEYLNSAAMFVFNLLQNKWQYFGIMMEPRSYHAACFFQGKLYIIGGYNPLECVDGRMQATVSTLEMNISTKRWRRRADMRFPRAHHGIIVVDEKIFVFGGMDSVGNILASVEMYEPQQDSWSLLPAIPEPVMGAAITSNNGLIYVIGGVTTTMKDHCKKMLSNKVLCFKPFHCRWYRKFSLPFPRAFCQAITLNQEIWLWGGAIISAEETLISINTVDAFELKGCKLNHCLNLPIPKHSASVAKIDNKVFIVGGMNSTDQVALTSTDIYNTESGKMFKGPDLPVPLTGTGVIGIPSECISKDDRIWVMKRSEYDILQNAARKIQSFYRQNHLKKKMMKKTKMNTTTALQRMDRIDNRINKYLTEYRLCSPIKEEKEELKEFSALKIKGWPPHPDTTKSVFKTVIDQVYEPSEEIGFRHYITLPLQMDPNLGIVAELKEDFQHAKRVLGLRTVEQIPPYAYRFQPTGDIQDDTIPVLIVFGGINPRDPLNTVNGRCILQYHPLKDRWEFFGFMPYSRNYHASVLYQDVVYVTGGYDPDNLCCGEMVATKTTFAFNIKTHEWTRKTDMLCARANHGLVVIKDKLYAIGGRDRNGRVVASMESYNPNTDVWEVEKPMGSVRMGMAVVNQNDVLWVLGGMSSLPSKQKTPPVLDSVLRFEVSNKRAFTYFLPHGSSSLMSGA